MATLRTLLTHRAGTRFLEASEEARAETARRWRELREDWKKDPGIKYICSYEHPGVGHNLLFEIDDVTKFAEMTNAYWKANFQIDEYDFALVWGNPKTDEFWKS